MSVNDNTKSQFYFLNDKRVEDLDAKVASIYQTVSGLDGAVSGLGYSKSGQVNSAINSSLSNFYNKTEVDTALSGKANSGDIPDVSGFLTSSDVYLKNEVDTALSGKANLSALDSKASSADVYTKVQSDAKYALSADIPDVSGKLNTADLQGAIDGLQRYALSSDIPDISGKASSSQVSAIKSALVTLLNALADGSGGALHDAYVTASSAINTA